jgi:leader peptidase (prepilin peptidase) / N-methyltransferase
MVIPKRASTRIHPTLFLVVLTAVMVPIVASVTWRVGVIPVLPAVVTFTIAGIVLAAIDIATHRLPNIILLPSTCLVLILLLLAAIINSEWKALSTATVGAILLFLFYFLIAIISPTAIGMGDVKFAALIGSILGWFGWRMLLVGLLSTFLLGGVWAGIALLSRRTGFRGSVPFGPSMVGGSLLALLFV